MTTIAALPGSWSRGQRLQLSSIVAVIGVLHIVGWSLYLSVTSGPLGAGAFAGAGVLAYVAGHPARVRRRPHRRDRRHHPTDGAARPAPGRGRLLLRDGPLLGGRRPRAPRRGRRRRRLERLARVVARDRRRGVHGRGHDHPGPRRRAQRARAQGHRRVVARPAPRAARRGRARAPAGQPRAGQPHPRRPGTDADQALLAHVPARHPLRPRPRDRLGGHAADALGLHGVGGVGGGRRGRGCTAARCRCCSPRG